MVTKNIEFSLKLSSYKWNPDEFMKSELIFKSTFKYIEKCSSFSDLRIIYTNIINFLKNCLKLEELRNTTVLLFDYFG